MAERVIGHSPRDQLQKVYNRFEYVDERRDALEPLGDRAARHCGADAACARQRDAAAPGEGMTKKTARRAAPRTTPPPRSHLVRLNKMRCELAAGVTFDARAWEELEWLAEYCVLYADPSVEGQRAPLFMMKHFKPPPLSGVERKQRADILPMLAQRVAEVFHASGGKERARLT